MGQVRPFYFFASLYLHSHKQFIFKSIPCVQDLYNDTYNKIQVLYLIVMKLSGWKQNKTSGTCPALPCVTSSPIGRNITHMIWDKFWRPVSSGSGLILGLRPANERRRYFVTTSFIGWAQIQNHDVFHWLGANLELALRLITFSADLRDTTAT